MFALPVLVLTLAQEAATPPPPPPADAAAELKECDAVLASHKTETARACYEALRLKHPGTPEAGAAERSLAALAVTTGPGAAPLPAPPPAAVPEGKKPGFYVVEPYSQRTQERLRLTTWEKLDFGTTAFLYGLTTGASFSAATDDNANPLPAMVIGSTIYTGLAVLYVNTATVDRADLPLTLAITSYIPVTAGFVTLASDATSGRTAASIIAGSGLAALPIAYLAAANTDLDPGDTQLVRDAGFWGAVWGVTAAISGENVEDRTIGVSGLVGLYGGLGLGLLMARTSDVSLERVRVTTWGGYGGAIVGGLTAAASEPDQVGTVFAGIGIGSALGVLVTFLSTGSIDDIPADAQFQAPASASLRYLEPTYLPMVERDGRVRPRLGLNVVRGRF